MPATGIAVVLEGPGCAWKLIGSRRGSTVYFDLASKGGEAVDPGNRLQGRADVGIRGGVIAAVDRSLHDRPMPSASRHGDPQARGAGRREVLALEGGACTFHLEEQQASGGAPG